MDTPGQRRSQYALPPARIYLNGNSLGPMPHTARQAVVQGLDDQWAMDAVGAWNSADWIHLPQRLGRQIGQLIGAAEGQTVVADSTSINVFKLLHAALARHPERRLLLLEKGAFPTDNYIAQGYTRLRPDLELQYIDATEAEDALSDEVAAVLLSPVQYRTGVRVDLPRVQASATRHDIPVVWDLAHAAGAYPLELDHWGVEYAVGCGYKFLNGGPGAPSFAFVAQPRQAELEPVISGWFGHQDPFDFASRYLAAKDINRLQVGTPPILSMLALEAAVEELMQTPTTELWLQSQQLFDSLHQALIDAPEFVDCKVVTPANADHRGSQLSITHVNAHALCRALAEEKVIADYREPGILRIGLAPAYNTLGEVQDAARILLGILRSGIWKEERFSERQAVT